MKTFFLNNLNGFCNDKTTVTFLSSKQLLERHKKNHKNTWLYKQSDMIPFVSCWKCRSRSKYFSIIIFVRVKYDMCKELLGLCTVLCKECKYADDDY